MAAILAGIITANSSAYVEGQLGPYGLLNTPAILDAPGLNDFLGRTLTVNLTDARVGDQFALLTGVAVNIGSGPSATTGIVTVDVMNNVYVKLASDGGPVLIGNVIGVGTATMSFSLFSFPSDARVTALLEAITYKSTSEDPNGNLTNANDTIRNVEVVLSNATGDAIEETATMQISVDDTNDAIVPVGTTSLILGPGATTEGTSTGAGATAASATGIFQFKDVDFVNTSGTTNSFQASALTTDVVILDTLTSTPVTYTAAILANLKSLLTLDTLTLDTGTGSTAGDGSFKYTLTVPESSLDFLAAGESRSIFYTITLNDSESGNDTADTQIYTITLNVIGTNDKPVITIEAGDSNAAGATETNAGITLSDTLTVTDADYNDTVAMSVDAVSTSGTYTGPLPSNSALLSMMGVQSGALLADATSGTQFNWNFNSGSEAFDFLGNTETLVLTYTLKAQDSSSASGGTDTETVTITITGTNDAPNIRSTVNLIENGSFESPDAPDGGFIGTDPIPNWVTQTVLLSGQEIVDDSFQGANGTPARDGDQWLDTEGSPGGINISQVVAGVADGQSYTLSFSVANTFNTLPGTKVDIYFGANLVKSISASDLPAWDGTNKYRDFSVTVLGGIDDAANTLRIQGVSVSGNPGYGLAIDALSMVADAPTVAASLIETDAGLITSGTLNVVDPDSADTVDLTVDAVAVSGTGPTTPLSNDDLKGMLSLSVGTADADPAGGDDFTWTFDSSSEAFDYLADGETLILTYTVKASDGGLNDTQTVKVTITGTNDTPVITIVDVTGAVTEDLAVTAGNLTNSGSITFTDLDVTDTSDATVALQGAITTTGPAVPSGLATALANAVALTGDTEDDNNGTITWTFTVANSLTQYLADGETVTATYRISVKDDSGTANDTATQDVTVTITGTNDTPVITAVNVTGDVTEDATTPNLTDTGSVTFTDADTTDTSDATVALLGTPTTDSAEPIPAALSAALANAVSLTGDTLDANSGTIDWTFSLANSLTQYLADGETVTATYRITVQDDSGTSTDTAFKDVTVTITGTNDAPVIVTNLVQNGSFELPEVSPDGSYTVANPLPGWTSAAADLEVVEVPFGGVPAADGDQWLDSQASPGGIDISQVLTLNTDENYTLTFAVSRQSATPAGSNLEVWFGGSLLATISGNALGVNSYSTFTYTVEGGTDNTLRFVGVGTSSNVGLALDAVSVTSSTTGAVTELPDLSITPAELTTELSQTGSINFADVDLTDTHSVTVQANPGISISGGSPVIPAAGLGTLAATVVNDTTGDGTGSVKWTYTVLDGALDFLAAGETVTQTYTVEIKDNSGEANDTVTQTVTITLTGTNDKPVITGTGANIAGEVTEDATTPNLTDTGSITFTDVDSTDTSDASVALFGPIVTDGPAVPPALAAALANAVTLSGDILDDNAGTITWDFSLANNLTQYLAAGETVTATYRISVKDDSGQSNDTATKDITVTITGTNDAPVIRTNLLTDGDFEATNLTPGAPGVSTDGTGSWVVGSFGAWTVTGTGGAFNPASPEPIANNDTDVAWLIAGSSLEQTVGIVPANQTFQFSVILANRTDQSGATGFLKVMDGFTLVASIPFDTNTILPDGTFSTVPFTVTTPVFTSTGNLRVIVENVSGGQVLVDNATLISVQPSMLTETDSTISITGMLNVVDTDLTDEVTLSVDAAPVGLAGSPAVLALVPASLDDATLKGMFTVTPSSPTEVNADDIGGTNFSWTFTSGSAGDQAFNFLNNGETLTLTYTIKAEDDSGTANDEDLQTVSITITGTNDLPVITGGPATGAVADVSETAAQDPSLSTGDLTQSGTIAFTDADISDANHTPNLVSATPTGDTVGFIGSAADYLTLTTTNTATAAAGTLNWSFSAPESAFDYLNNGETLTLTYVVSVSDEAGASNTETITITVTGANDAPVITSADQTASVTEAQELSSVPPSNNAGPLTTAGQLLFTDVDIRDSAHTAQVTVAATGQTDGFAGTASGYFGTTVTNTALLADGTIDWTFNAPESDFDYLANGETLILTYTITVTDEALVSNSRTVTVTVNGKNDGPTVEAAASDVTVIEFGTPSLADSPASGLSNAAAATDFLTVGAAVTATDTFTFDDVDLTDTHSIVDTNGAAAGNASIVSGSWDRSGVLSTLTLTPTQIENIGSVLASVSTPATGPSNGVISWTFSATEGSLDFLAAGETLTLVYRITIKDDSGVSANDTITKDVTVTINGTNDAPVITSAPFTPAFTEANDTGNFFNRYNEQGTIQFTDVDVSQTVTNFSLQGVTVTQSPGLVGAVPSAATLLSYFDVGSFGPVIIPDSAPGILANNTGTSSNPQTLTTGVDGSFGWRFRAEHDDFDFLNDTETLTLTYMVRVTDPSGAYDEQPVTLTITGRNELIVGTGFDDVINQADSSPLVAGDLTTQFGDDIDAGAGDDVVVAAAGPDDIVGGQGDDDINAGSGNDFIAGDNGDVGLLARGTAGAETAGDGDDVLDGGSGNDTIYGQGGDDEIIGGSGNDSIVGGSGADTISGGTGNDTITAGDGDVIDGGGNADTILVSGSWLDYDITRNDDGSVTFTKDNGEAADESFTVRNVEEVTFDNGAAPDTTITVAAAVDDKPVITDLAGATVLENNATDGTVLVDTFSVTDADAGILGEAVNVALINDSGLPFGLRPGVLSGQYEIFVDGDLDREAVGSYTLTIQATDAKGAVTSQSITVTIGDVNDNKPVITNVVTTATVAENNAATVVAAITTTDVDLVNGTTTYTLGGEDAAKFEISAAGVLTFKAGANFESGSDDGDDTYEVSVTANDGANDSLAKDFSVTVTNVNEVPTIAAPASAITTPEDQTVTITNATLNALVGDPELDDGQAGATVTLSAIVTTSTGVPVYSFSGYDLATGGNVSFTPPLNYNGTLNVTLTATDQGGLTTSRTVSVVVSPVNDAPVANADSGINGTEDTPLVILPATLLGNDTDVDGDTLTISGVSAVTNGTVALVSGNVVFTPDADFNGIATFQYTISDGAGGTSTATATVNIAPVNDAPEFVEIADQSMAEDTTVSVTLDAGLLGSIVSDVEGDVLTLSAVVMNGSTVVATYNGLQLGSTVTFTPPANFNGDLTVTVTANDGNGGSDTASFTLTVNPVNDAPVAASGIAVSGTEDAAAITGSVSGTDIDGDDLTFSLVAPVEGLTLNEDGSFSFVPAESDQALGEGESRVVTFEYVANDGTVDSAPKTATITINGVNDAPVFAEIADQAIDEDTTVSVTLDAGLLGSIVSDVEGDTLTLSAVVMNGSTVVATYNGLQLGSTVTFTPPADFNGDLTVTVTANDGNGGSDTASFTLTVDPVNDAPVVSGPVALASILEDAPTITITKTQLLANTTDVDGDTLSVSGLTASSGLVVDNGDGTFSYTPVANFNGPVTFNYSVSDGIETVATSGTMMVTSVNDLPTASSAGNAVSGAEDNVIIGSVPAGSDVETATSSLTYMLDGPAVPGLVFNPNGTFAYTPALNFNGTVNFSYQVVDADGGKSVPKTFAITVTPVNDAPVVADGTASTNEDTAIEIDLASLISDVDSTAFTVTSATSPNGTVTIAGTTLTFTPNEDYNGPATISYTVSDGALSDSGVIAVTVNAVNDAPVVSDALVNAGGLGYGTVGAGGYVVGEFTVADVDNAVVNLSFSDSRFSAIAGAAPGQYKLVAVAGSVFDSFEGAELTVTVTANDGSLTDSQDYTILLGDSLGGASTELSISEQAAIDALVGLVEAPAGAGGLSFAFAPGGDAGGLFTIDSATGELKVAGGLNFEALANHILTVQVDSDRGSYTTQVLVNVNDVQVLVNGDNNANTLFGPAGDEATINALGGDDVVVSGNRDDSVNGGGGNDALFTGAGNDSVTGGAGNDFIAAGAGNDTVDGGDGFDYVSYADAGSGVTISLETAGAQNTGGGGTDTLINVEAIYGSEFNDVFTGNDADVNAIYGLGGNDLIMGNGGFDYIEAGAGNDTIDAGSGDDYILAGDGIDLVSYESSTTAVYVDLTRMDLGETGNFANGVSTGLDIMTGVENVNGSALGDIIYGSSANNTINGGAGDDVLFGFGGDDALTGGLGTDYIVGGAGNDVLTGGNGQDFFYFFSQTDGKDTITDWRTDGFDLLIFDEPSFGGGLTPGAYLDASRFVAGTAATNATGQFLWNSATSTLSWDQDGTGVGAAVQIATLTGVSNLTASDILIL